MNRNHHSSPARTATQTASKLSSTTNIIDTLSDQLEYLHVSTQNTSAELLTNNTTNHEFGAAQPESKRPWSDSQGSGDGQFIHQNRSKTTNNRHSPAKSPRPQLINLPTSAPGQQNPQPLLQLMPHTPQPPLSPGASLMSPEYYYWNQPYYTNQYQQYPNGVYCPPSGPYQWPANINFIPNLFVMANAGPSQHGGNYGIPPPNFQPVPLMKQPFRQDGRYSQDSNRRFGNRMHTQSESGGRGLRNGNGQIYRRQGSKTALCRNISEFNNCSFGDRCYFAHSADELKPKPANSKYKTVSCTAYTEKGSCPYGSKCHFIHNEDDRPPTDPLRR